MAMGGVSAGDGEPTETDPLVRGSARDQPPPLPPWPLILFYVSECVTLGLRTFEDRDPAITFDRHITLWAGFAQGCVNIFFFFFSWLWLLFRRSPSGGETLWEIVKGRQRRARNAILQLMCVAVTILITVDVIIAVQEGGAAKPLVQVFVDLFGYPTLFVVWLCPPARPKLSTLFHFTFVICVSSFSLYQLQVRTNHQGHYDDLTTRRTFAQLLVIFEINHAVVGAKYVAPASEAINTG